MLYTLVILGFILCLAASANVSRTFKKYGNDFSVSGLTGAETARKILDENGLFNVTVGRVSGKLTDHYDPGRNAICLSDSVYSSRSVAALGVAAHECGHAIQYAEGYTPIKIRTAIIPVTQFGSRIWYFIFILGLIMGGSYGTAGYFLVNLGIWLFAAVVFFQAVTLPVEFDASRRAMKTLSSHSILVGEELVKARKMLTAAALTYAAALASSVLQLLRLIAIRNNRR